MKKTLKFFVLVAAAWSGGFCCQLLFPNGVAAAAARILQAEQLWIYGHDGNHRLQMGTYTAPGEKGLPLIGLSDNSGHLRLLFRLAGPTESPVIVFKDKDGFDKLLIGLDPDNGEEPYKKYA